MSIRIDRKYTTYLGKKYGDTHPIEDVNVFNKDGSIKETFKTFSPYGTTSVLGGAFYWWGMKSITDYEGITHVTGANDGFSDIKPYIDADKNESIVFAFWNPKTKSYHQVALGIDEREEMIGYRYFEDSPYFVGYAGESVKAHDLKFYGGDKEWAYDVTQGTAYRPSDDLNYGKWPESLTFYTTNSPFVSYIRPNDPSSFIDNLHIVPMVRSFVKNVDGAWVGKLGFGIYRNTYGVKTWSSSSGSMADFEIMSIACPDENGPFGNWLVNINSPELSKKRQWYEGSYGVNLNTNVTIE